MANITNSLADSLASDLFSCHVEGRDNIDRVLLYANFIFDDPTSQQQIDLALDILDRSNGNIQSFRGSLTPQVVFSIPSSKGSVYHCLLNFCPCKHYFEINKVSPKVIWCKHLLAVRLALGLKMVDQTIIPDDEFYQLLIGINNEG